MSPQKIRITGEKKDNVAADNTATLAITETYYISSATRGEVAPSHEIPVVDAEGKNRIIEFTYEDDTVWIGDITTIDEIFFRNLGPILSLIAKVFFV